jgi:hypothetical protein
MKGLPVNRENIEKRTAFITIQKENSNEKTPPQWTGGRSGQIRIESCPLHPPVIVPTGWMERTGQSRNRYLRIHLSVVKAARG